jgi:uncharacterized protein YydD (DUF2326 family)
MTATPDAEGVPIETLIRVFVKMRDKKAEINKTLSEIDDKMKKVNAAILEHLKAISAESVRTEDGTAYRTTKSTYTTNDWVSMNSFILEHQVPDLLEKRIHQTNMKAFLEENPDLLPPGLNAITEYSVTVRRS